MAIGGCEVSYCFLDEGIFIMTDTDNKNNIIPDMTDMDEVRKAIIANEILNRKY